MKDTIKVVVTVIRDEPFGAEHGAHKGARIYKFAELMGAMIGIGNNCPLTMSAEVTSGESPEIVSARLQGKLDNICGQALICENIATENAHEKDVRERGVVVAG